MLQLFDPIFTLIAGTLGFWWAVLITIAIILFIIGLIVAMIKSFFDNLDL